MSIFFKCLLIIILTSNAPINTFLVTSVANVTVSNTKTSSVERAFEYFGNISQTYSGKLCESWANLDKRHQKRGFNRKDLQYMHGYNNYCRNPDNDTLGPWCFTTDIYTSWQYCIISGYTVGIHPTYLWHIAYDIHGYMFPIIGILGTILNVLSISTFRRPKLQKKTTSFLLAILAVTDTTALYMGAMEKWLRYITNGNLSSTNDVTCKVYLSIHAIMNTCSGWIIVTVTLERVISMTKPFNLAWAFSKRNVTKILLGMFIFITLCHIPLFLFLQSVHKIILYENSYTFRVKASCNSYSPLPPRIHVAIQCFIPSSLILIGNIIVIILLYKTQQRRQNLHSNSNDHSNLDQTISLAILLLTTSFTYLCLTLPYTILLMSKGTMRHYSNSSHEFESTYFFYESCATYGYYTNNSINFILYCMAGRLFRREFMLMMRSTKCLHFVSSKIAPQLSDSRITHTMPISNTQSEHNQQLAN